MSFNKQERKILFLSSVGGILEFYDFIIYVIFSQILGKIFFPSADKFASLMSVYAIFAIGYLVRPLGGIVFSHFGDKYGRKVTFIVSVMMMAIPTFCIGLLPTYSQIGITASLLLILMRILQGLSVGGEIPGALTFVSEHMNSKYKSLACGIIFASLNIGILLGALVNLVLISSLSDAQMLTYGWRIPFLFGGVLGIISFFIRKQMSESPSFAKLKQEAKTAKVPFFEACQKYWPQLLQGTGITILGAVVINMLFLFMPTYLSSFLGYSVLQAAQINTTNLLIYSSLLIVMCWIGDKFGREKTLMIGSLGFIVFGYFIFANLIAQTAAALLLSMMLIIVLSSVVMVYTSLLVDLFPVHIRYTGVAIAYNTAFAFFGGLTSLFSTYLIKTTGSLVSPSYYLIFCAVLCFVSVLSIRKIQYSNLARVSTPIEE